MNDSIATMTDLHRFIVKDKKNIPLQRFIEFITMLDRLDEPETYSYVFTILNDIGISTGNTAAANAVNVVVNNLARYTMIDREAKTMKVDLEEIILEIADKYSATKSGSFELLLDIGINQAMFLNSNGYRVSDTESITNLSFASEKIGFRWKLCDFERIRQEKIDQAYDEKIGELKRFQFQQKPSVLNVHFRAYGSGLLYNLVDLKTSNNFNSAIGGAGIGLSFFNGLDASVNIAHAFDATSDISKDNAMITIGFDVRMTEYIKKVREKRMAKDEAERQQKIAGAQR